MPFNRELLEFEFQPAVQRGQRLAEEKSGEIDRSLLAFADSLDIQPRPSGMPSALRQQEARRQAELIHARGELERSPLPGWKAYSVAAGAPIVSLLARAGGASEYADRMNRHAAAIEQAQREREKGGIVPDILQRGLRGAGASLTSMVPAAAVAGPYGAIAFAAAQETNSAYTQGKDAGKKGGALAAYAINRGLIEGLPATVMQKIGLGGLESLVSKKAVSAGLKEGLKRVGVSWLQEVPEELITEIGHSLAAYFSGVDPSALDSENLIQSVAETVVQTTFAVGLGGGPGVARSMQAGQIQKIRDEMVESAEGRMAPSVRDWRRWGISPELGKSRRQRKAFVQEFARQLETEAPPVEQGIEPPTLVEGMPAEAPPGALEGPEAAITEPTADVEAPVALEVPEVAVEPEAVTEAPGAPDVPVDLEATALNKATGNRIREIADLSALNEEAVQTMDSVLENVLETGRDEQALDIAAEILESNRQVTAHEHTAMVVKADKLLTELDDVRQGQAKAAETWNETKYKLAMKAEMDIVDQLDELTQAARNSRREVARALSIGRLRLSRENFDVANILERMQITKGPGKKLTVQDRSLAARLSKEYAERAKELKQIEQEIREAEEKRDEVLAGKVLEINKPRREIGRGIKERARAEREDIKNQIRQMGLRVNDITGVSAEGLYLVGRLGITYIKEGAGTLVEVAENLRRDMPDLNLTQHDVNQALIARSPKEKTHARSETAKRVAKLKSMARMEAAIEEMAQGIYQKAERNVAPTDKDLKVLKKKFTKLSNEYFASERYDEKLVNARETIHRLQDQLENGRKRIKEEPEEVPPELAGLQDQIRQLRMEIRTDEKLADVNEQLRTGNYTAPVKVEKKPVNQKLQRKQTELMRKRRQIIQAIADTAPWTTGKVAKEVAFSLKAVAATADLSFTMRQNFWQVLSHPVLATKIIGPSFKAFFSEFTADQINSAILHSENAFLYEQSGLAILDANSPDAQQKSEVFRARVLERGGRWNILGTVMKASSRHAAIISNLMRTSSFDQFIADNPNATTEEMKLMADYINVSTGLGNLGKAGAIGEALQLGLFSPKFSWSRIELPIKMLQVLTNRGKYRNMPTVRKQMAGDLVAVVGTGVMVLTLADLAGFDVEWLDPDDPDWGKIRIGDMRIDIWGGFQQPARAIVRMITGAMVRDFDPLEILGRFAAFKFSPAVTVPIEALRGKTAVGEDVTLVETAYTTAMPLVARDVQEAWEEHGAKGAVAAGTLGTVGIGVSTYKDSETATRREISKLKKKGEWGKAEKIYWEWNSENPDDQISRKWFKDSSK